MARDENAASVSASARPSIVAVLRQAPRWMRRASHAASGAVSTIDNAITSQRSIAPSAWCESIAMAEPSSEPMRITLQPTTTSPAATMRGRAQRTRRSAGPALRAVVVARPAPTPTVAVNEGGVTPASDSPATIVCARPRSPAGRGGDGDGKSSVSPTATSKGASAASSSAIDAKRPAGSLAMARWMTSSKASGSSLRSVLGRSGSSQITLVKVRPTSPPPNAACPVTAR